MTTQKHLYPNEVQLAIFQQLLTYETLLKEGCHLDIQKYPENITMRATLWKKAKPEEIPHEDPEKCWRVHRPYMFNLSKPYTAKDVDEAIYRWWQSVPAECKI